MRIRPYRFWYRWTKAPVSLSPIPFVIAIWVLWAMRFTYLMITQH